LVHLDFISTVAGIIQFQCMIILEREIMNLFLGAYFMHFFTTQLKLAYREYKMLEIYCFG